ncbi:hypothetical protein TRV_01340 [Trichophyton verrucosum HKI 0517]|uniref:Uncharacterized protein n=1 Tax=Trichophyton verrucosum (strain HKI 0517) TaxID=663202 RepID=D4D2N4_TRIVH|nr:uncharacterized protein TRV_01340 [Trichophyton verrucosum HKI 0517]EFE43898.1 hypothetical protein TRV_01340 [Trichophyton verrucosum HKI 0517]
MIPDMLIVVSSSPGCCDEAGIPRKRSLPSLSQIHSSLYPKIPKKKKKKKERKKKEKGTLFPFIPLCFVLFYLPRFMYDGWSVYVASLVFVFFTLAYSTDLTDASNVLQDHTSALFLLTFDRLENLFLICVAIYPLLVHIAQFHLILLMCLFYSFCSPPFISTCPGQSSSSPRPEFPTPCPVSFFYYRTFLRDI